MNFDILVVDDSKAALFMFKKIISLSGVPLGNLLTADNGLNAIEVLKENPVDLILTDINMPEMDGFQLIEYLKGDPSFKHIPIILATAVNQRTKFKFDIEKDGDFLPVEKFMEKPIDPDDLIVTIRGLLK